MRISQSEGRWTMKRTGGNGMKKIYEMLLGIVVALAMMLTMTPMATTPVYADDEVPECTVIIEPGSIGGEPITVKSTDPGMLAETPSTQESGEFYWNSVYMNYKFPNPPDSFVAPNGVHFIGWKSEGDSQVRASGWDYSFVDNYSITLTAVWEVTVSFDSNGGTGEMNSVQVKLGDSYILPGCGFTAPDEQKVFKGWNTAKSGFGTWYDPGDTLTPGEDVTLYARWGEPVLSLCSYDVTNSKSSQGGKFIFDDGFGHYGGRWSPGCSNYTLYMNTGCIAIAAPDNGYSFTGWYKGKYIRVNEQGQPIQDAVPYMDQQVSTNRTYNFTVNSDLVLCPVFEEAQLVNFVDIGNIWTKLDPLNATPFTGETNPDEEGLSNFIELKEETWTSTDGEDVLTSEDQTRIPIVGKTYKYAATIAAKGENAFDPVNKFRFIYGGREYSLDDLEVTISADNKTATISGFIPDQTVEAVDLKDAKISGLAAKTYNGKAQTQKPVVKLDVNGTKFTLENGIDYAVSYKNNIKAGTATVTVGGKGIFTGNASSTFKINKANNPLSIKARTATVKYTALKKKAQALAVSKVISFTRKGQGTMAYTKVSGNKKITINKKNGTVTVGKKLKKGTYKVKVKVSAAGNANYKASSKTVTFTVRVK